MNYYKVLRKDGLPHYCGTGKWYLPTDEPGKWMLPIEGELLPCKNGYHLCRRADLVRWLGPEIYEAEYRGDLLAVEDKVVVREARLVRRVDTWTERTARLFACDCTERALNAVGNPDSRSVEAVRVARLYADGQASLEDLTAARDAARDTAWDAAGDAARAAAAWDAARNAAWTAERRWQTERLFHYLEGVSDE